jgi:replicative superfamily II helicase
LTTPRIYTEARNNLRRGRIEEALNLALGADVPTARNNLLQLLLEAADADDIEFETLTDWQVDSVCSIAQARIDESDIDQLLVLLMCIRILAKDGQFARLRTLTEKIQATARSFEPVRPLLSVTCSVISLMINGSEIEAQLTARRALGMDSRATVSRLPQTTDNLHDSLGLATILTLSAERDFGHTERIRNIAFRRNDPTLLAAIDAADSVCRAADHANTLRCLQASDPSFLSERLSNYIHTRGVHTLLPAQMLAIREGATLDQDQVVALPTSSGKTFIAELRIAGCLHRQHGATALYVAPYRLLARQVERSLRTGLSSLGISVVDLGGSFDSSGDELRGFARPDVSIATPERLDSLLRISTTNGVGSEEARSILEDCKLLVFDEIQLIGRSGRGHRFELITTRLRMLYPQIRLLGLAAASFGTNTLASWASGRPPITGAKRPTGTVEIRWEPSGRMMQRVGTVSSRITTLTRSGKAADDAARLALRFSKIYMPILAVETSRPTAEGLARRIFTADRSAAAAWHESLDPQAAKRLEEAVAETQTILGEDHPLAKYLIAGIAYHHAGLPSHILRHIESLAEIRALRVVCSTTTVAEGADLPFRVVIIPHLNFAGESRRLERDLYQNIIGRAGRVNVAMEGIVFVLESSSRTLRNIVTAELWSTSPPSEISGTLAGGSTGQFGAGLPFYEDLKTQVLAWIGESGAGLDQQADVLTDRTLTARQGEVARISTRNIISRALVDLEREGLAVSASPYALTELGSRSRLAGLSSFSCLRINQLLTSSNSDLPLAFMAQPSLSSEDSLRIAALTLQSLETLEQTIWMKAYYSSESATASAVQSLIRGDLPWPTGHEFYAADLNLLAAWIRGATFSELGELAPVISGNRGQFRGHESTKRASDAAEYIGRITFPASWTWSAIKAMIGPQSEEIPGYIRQCIEYGCYSDSAVQLIRQAGLTRNSANTVASALAYDWASLCSELAAMPARRVEGLPIASLDLSRLESLRQKLAASL